MAIIARRPRQRPAAASLVAPPTEPYLLPRLSLSQLLLANGDGEIYHAAAPRPRSQSFAAPSSRTSPPEGRHVVPTPSDAGDYRASRICAAASSSAQAACTPSSPPTPRSASLRASAASPEILFLQQRRHVLVGAHAELGLHHSSYASASNWAESCALGVVARR
jgi:hypothetical protein